MHIYKKALKVWHGFQIWFVNLPTSLNSPWSRIYLKNLKDISSRLEDIQVTNTSLNAFCGTLWFFEHHSCSNTNLTYTHFHSAEFILENLLYDVLINQGGGLHYVWWKKANSEVSCQNVWRLDDEQRDYSRKYPTSLFAWLVQGTGESIDATLHTSSAFSVYMWKNRTLFDGDVLSYFVTGWGTLYF